MRKKINFPTTVKAIKLHQIIKIQKLLANENLKDNTRKSACLSEWTGAPIEDLYRTEQKQIDELYQRMQNIIDEEDNADFQRFITIEGREFAYIPDIDSIPFAEFGDLDTIATPDENGKGGGFGEFHKVLAILYRPILTRTGDRYKLIDYVDEPEESKTERERFFLKHMNYHEARQGLFFFLKFTREHISYYRQSQKLQESLEVNR